MRNEFQRPTASRLVALALVTVLFAGLGGYVVGRDWALRDNAVEAAALERGARG